MTRPSRPTPDVDGRLVIYLVHERYAGASARLRAFLKEDDANRYIEENSDASWHLVRQLYVHETPGNVEYPPSRKGHVVSK